MTRTSSRLSIPVFERLGGVERWVLAVIVAIPLVCQAQQADPSAVKVAALRYGQGEMTTCFSAGFLDVVARHTRIELARQLVTVDLASDRLFGFPFVVMGADRPFALSPAEIRNLRAYLDRGGFLLASAACSDGRWAASFQAAIEQVYPDLSMQPVPVSHPVFQTLYEIEAFQGTHRPVEQAMPGLMVNDRLAVLFSPVGLHDTDYVSGGTLQAGADSAAARDADCCCCGGNELRDAHLINANILAYVLTR